MLYYLYQLQDIFSPLRIFQYITLRSILAASTAFIITVLIAPWVIKKLHQLKYGQYIRNGDGEKAVFELHGHKQGTPTMGGVIIIFAVVVSTLLWSPITNVPIYLTLSTLIYMGAVGFLDDYTKIKGKQSKGLSARRKLFFQILWGVIIGCLLYTIPETKELARCLMVPFLKNPLFTALPLIFVIIFSSIVITASSNATNLTDGLDGLAIGCTISVTMAYMVLAYVAGNTILSNYLLVPYVPGCGEITIFCGALLGSSLGFLWYNCHPAQVFMGDTGSLAIGGSIAMIALLVKQELLLIIIGGVFVMESISVILQVTSYKYRGGKRIFLMAPIHHHFEKKGWSETQVTIRFWIISIICAIIGLATLKIR